MVRERGGNGPKGGGRPWCLPLADRVLLIAVHSRTNLTTWQPAPLFGCSPATVRRVTQRLRPLLAIEPAHRPADAMERLRIVDGTLVPVRDRTVGASSRNRSSPAAASRTDPVPASTTGSSKAPAWLHGFRRLRHWWEQLHDIHEAFLDPTTAATPTDASNLLALCAQTRTPDARHR
jgi:hypothetical protein